MTQIRKQAIEELRRMALAALDGRDAAVQRAGEPE
jgi:hypothetical protein